MNKKQQRALSFIIIASVLLMLGSAVYAESYSSTLNVSSQLDGSARYYSGSTINIACRNTYLNTVFNTTSDTLRVGCFKKGFLGIYFQVGSSVVRTVTNSGYTTVSGSWTMDGNGTYRFRFLKGLWNGMQEQILSDDVDMWSN